MSIRRLHAAIEFLDDKTELVNLLTRVETMAAGTSLREDLTVTVLPAAERLRRHTEHVDHRSDAVNAVAITFHADRIAYFSSSEEVLQESSR